MVPGSAGPEFQSNNAGGILGGISTGQDILIRFAVKPASSILASKRTVDKCGKATDVATKDAMTPASEFGRFRLPKQ